MLLHLLPASSICSSKVYTNQADAKKHGPAEYAQWKQQYLAALRGDKPPKAAAAAPQAAAAAGAAGPPTRQQRVKRRKASPGMTAAPGAWFSASAGTC